MTRSSPRGQLQGETSQQEAVPWGQFLSPRISESVTFILSREHTGLQGSPGSPEDPESRGQLPAKALGIQLRGPGGSRDGGQSGATRLDQAWAEEGAEPRLLGSSPALDSQAGQWKNKRQEEILPGAGQRSLEGTLWLQPVSTTPPGPLVMGTRGPCEGGHHRLRRSTLRKGVAWCPPRWEHGCLLRG